ncbi:hypothetical protein [Aquifex sp.]
MRGLQVTKLLKILLPVFLWGFLIYNLLPFGYFEIYEVEERLAPRPYVERITYYFGVKVDDPEETLEILEEKGVDRLFGFVRGAYGGRIFPIGEIPKCDLIILSDVPFTRKLLNFFLEFLPYRVVSQREINFAYHLEPTPSYCKVLFTPTLYEGYPKFLRDFLLDRSRNFVYKRVYGRLVLERNIIVNGNNKVEIYGYSTRSFYYPGESTVYPFKVFVNTNRSNTLVIVFRDGKPFRVYDTDRVVFKVRKEGEYVVKVYKYRFKFLNYYFGLRFVAYSSPIRLTY